MRRKPLPVVILVLLCIALAVTSLAIAGKKPPPPPPPGGCLCPDIYAPVTCSNGVTYSNACVASCNKATDCVPAGAI